MSIRSRPPATAPSAEPNPVMLLGTVQKATRGADYWSIIEGPAYSLDLHILGIVGAHHVLGPHVVVVADLPENHHPGDLHLQVVSVNVAPCRGCCPLTLMAPSGDRLHDSAAYSARRRKMPLRNTRQNLESNVREYRPWVGGMKAAPPTRGW